MSQKKNPNRSLHIAKRNKNDEFYTRLEDINNELHHYRSHFKNKVVYCNCDDPYISAFFEYFSKNFEQLGLKKLITTCYKNQNINSFSKHEDDQALKVVYGGGASNSLPQVEDITVIPLEGDGDFRSAECIEILQEADIVVTNPPFSLFREYITQLIESNKKFLVLGNKNAVTYKEIFPLIKNNEIWIGVTPMGADLMFGVSESHAEELVKHRKEGSAYKMIDGKVYARAQACWYTNLDHDKRHKPLDLYKRYSHEEYPHYDNFDAINVDKVSDIPEDWTGVLGVPITFLDKYNPEQFEIIKFRKGNDDKDLTINAKPPYFRILIRNRKPSLIKN